MAFRRGLRLITAGAASDAVLLIESGLVKVVLVAADGAESIVGFLGGGDLVGELGVLHRRPRSAHVVALTAGHGIAVPGERFRRLRGAHADVLDLVDQTWHRRQHRADERQLALARGVTSRLALSLWRWARDLGEPTQDGPLLRGISQRDMAQAIAVSEKSVEAALGALRAAGLVRTWRLGYLVVDPAQWPTVLPRLPEIRE